MKHWVVVETYYKHGEYQLHVFNNNKSLIRFILNHVQYQENEKRRLLLEQLPLNSLIKMAVIDGDNEIQNEGGWGIRAIRKVVPETSDDTSSDITDDDEDDESETTMD